MRFEQQVALVTGAASGIGRALVQRLVAEGAAVVAVDIVEAEFDNPPADWRAALEKLNGVASVTDDDGIIHISTTSGPLTVRELMDMARDRGVNVRRVSVQGTTLDDVFLYYTGRQLRDAASETVKRDMSHLYK